MGFSNLVWFALVFIVTSPHNNHLVMISSVLVCKMEESDVLGVMDVNLMNFWLMNFVESDGSL